MWHPVRGVHRHAPGISLAPPADPRSRLFKKGSTMLRSMKDLENYTIGATNGDIGQVTDFYFDDQAWVIRYLVVDAGSWLSSRKVLISPLSVHDQNWVHLRLPVSFTKEQVRNSPAIDTEKPVSRQHEIDDFSYFSHADYGGGAGIWGDGMYPYLMDPAYPPSGLDRADRDRADEALASAKEEQHRHDDPRLRSCKAVIGYHIRATDGDIGHVHSLLIDEESWAIRYLVVSTRNGWLGHLVLVAPQWIKDIRWTDKSVSVNLSRGEVRDAPPYKPTDELNREREADLYKQSGRLGYWAPTSQFP